MSPTSRTVAFLAILLLAPTSQLTADDGQPVAVRYWPDSGVTIETMWNLHLGLRCSDAIKQQLPQPLDVELDALKQASILNRLPNEEKPEWKPIEAFKAPTGNAVKVSPVPSSTPPKGSKQDSSFATVIEVDGVKIVDFGTTSIEQGNRELSSDDAANAALHSTDALLIHDPSATADALQSLAENLKPRIVVLPADNELTSIGDQKITIIEHNTLPISAATSAGATRWVKLGSTPWKMDDELATLFQQKEVACQDSRKTFAALSTNQMNFKPSNGTHTPRWNAEHMMGRELLFFSQIYHAIDPAVAVMDLNPKQMPKDYQAAHADWTGGEEARQMERVEAFTRRFAFLLAGVELDTKAPGSRFWTPRALLKQMENHYSEHTANVIKKMQLDEWPKE